MTTSKASIGATADTALTDLQHIRELVGRMNREAPAMETDPRAAVQAVELLATILEGIRNEARRSTASLLGSN